MKAIQYVAMMAVAALVALSTYATACPPFDKAEPVWAKGQATEMNSSVRFRAEFETEIGTKPFLRITGTSAYRIRLNGRYVGYGPARSPKGFFRVDEWPLGAAMREGRNELEIDAVGYNCNSFCFQDQPAFLQAEVVADGKVVAATAEDGGGFSAESTERIRKVPRYSFQRTFAEAYRYGNETKKLPLERRPDVRYLERIASYPKFELNDSLRVVSRAKATYDPNVQAKGVFFIDTDGNNPRFKAFAKSELESNPWDEAQKIKFSERVPCSAALDAPISLSGRESVRMDAGLNDCGFFGMKVKVAKPGRILFTFDEVLTDGEVSPTRMTCCNCVEWRFERPGAYEVETFEPYVWRYADLTAIDGDFEVSGLHVRAYKNPDAGRAAFRCSDPALEKIFEAARETFVQNAVDVFTDCPSRERAGWLCDSFFIGRVNKLLTGDTKLERLFLQNYAIADEFEYIPKGAIPMCYPADDLRGRFIPNWAMWLVIEVEEYLKRSGDRATVAALKPRLVAFVEYMKTFRNSDGLLEKLPSWVFVEWSQANKLVQDVNYPSNMTWAEVLDVMNRLYDMPELAAEAERVRETVRRQSWTGEWFCDNAVRQADGTLKLSGECTETCQYYAFFFRTATPKTYPRLWKTLVDDFGPKRLRADMKALKSHPEIWPSNAFIGNYLRLECLAREGLSGSILDETKGFFLYMAERTGTLWEMISPTASCDHGFASHAAVYLIRDILGVKSVDTKSREVVVEPPKDIGLDWCEGTLPISPGETVTIRWRRGENPTVEWNVALANHVRITSFDLIDQTDNHNELLRTREWTAQWNERTFNIATCALDIYDCENDTGRVFLRLAPLPHSRPVKCDDFCVDSVGRKITVLSNGYPFVMREYKGGKVGRIKAFHALQRELRPYRSGRDGRILSNNWGGGYSDSRLNQDYAMREIEAAAKIGVDVVQLDDGWQKGRSANSLLIKNRQKEGVWNGYWAFDPNFWDADPIRFSGGFKPLVAAAGSHGMDFGLWYGPDSSNDAANWERDADRLLKYFRETGIRYFKIDSMKSFTPLALSRQRAMFDKVLAGSSSNVVFDLDVTAEIRPGYFGLPDIGTLFVENRYAKHSSWWPHQTLRNLWSLSNVIDPVRLRMEFLDPKQHADRYAERFPGSPLRPELWRGDAVFATVMMASPLAWMEMQGLHHETVAEMSKIIARWKLERERIHTGDTFPVGSKPDGFSWTGFVTSALDGKGGYALLFRECSDAQSFSIDLSPYVRGVAIETLAGDGTAKLEGGVLTVEIPRRLGYLWLKIR